MKIILEPTDIVEIEDTPKAGEFAGKEVELLRPFSSGVWKVEDDNGKIGRAHRKFMKTVRWYHDKV